MSIKLEVTKEAQDQVRTLIEGQKPGTAVRVYLQPGGSGGGCGCGSGGCGSASAGPAMGMAFDQPRNGDQVIKVNGFSFVVDEMSAEYLDGGRIDFVRTLDASGFKITAPKIPDAPAESESQAGGCGCGAGGCGCG